MMRWEFINELIAARPGARYLEIGCGANATFSRIRGAALKVGVDPVRGGTHRLTSDNFFRLLPPQTFDVIFIDGLHLAEQVITDTRNALRVLSPGGVIVIHDCLPRSERQQYRAIQKGAWLGDVWKAAVTLRTYPLLDFAVFEDNWGLGVLLPRPTTSPIAVPPTLSWAWFLAEGAKFLRVTDIVGIRRFLSDVPVVEEGPA